MHYVSRTLGISCGPSNSDRMEHNSIAERVSGYRSAFSVTLDGVPSDDVTQRRRVEAMLGPKNMCECCAGDGRRSCLSRKARGEGLRVHLTACAHDPRGAVDSVTFKCLGTAQGTAISSAIANIGVAVTRPPVRYYTTD